MNIPKNLEVYVIEKEFKWVGILKSYYPSSGFCEVEDSDEEIYKVHINQVFIIEKLTPIKNILI